MQMTHKNLIAAIARYLSEHDTRYAVLLDGKWGSGKTYFVEKKLRPVIDKKKFHYVYVTLYGLESLDSLSTRIAARIFPAQVASMLPQHVRKSIASYAAALGKLVPKPVQKIAKGSKQLVKTASELIREKVGSMSTELIRDAFLAEAPNAANIFLCVDDLERMSPSLSYGARKRGQTPYGF